MTGTLNLAGYKLTFDDEFNSFSSNGPSNPTVTSHTGTWDTTYAYGERKLNDEVQLYSDPTVGVDPFAVSDGVLTITAAPSTNLSASWGQPYTSGAITTLHSFAQCYRYFEMRAKLPEGVGMWPAFWMVPKQHVWPPELDPLEAFGSNGPGGDGGAYSFHNGLVKTGSGGQGSWNGTNGANLYTQYNTFGVDWRPDTITFYLNGQSYASMATPAEFSQPMYLLANLAVGGNWAGAPIGETAKLKIDYIRAFFSDGANPAIAQQRISSPDGRGYTFSGALDANGNGALGGVDLPAPAPTVPAPIPPAPTGDQTVGSGPDALLLYMSEDYYLGDAQFIVSVDGTQIGGVLSTSASHAAGATQKFTMLGSFGAGAHAVSVYFLNNLGGAPGVDRNLFVSGASINGAAINGAVLNEYAGGAQGFSFVEVSPPKAVPDPMFDTAYYLAHNPDVTAAGVDPYQHYLRYGWHEGRNVSALFDTSYYLTQNPDVRAAGVDPLLHFEQYGWFEGRQPSLLFDGAKYLAANPDVAAAGVGSLQHYMQYGHNEGRMAFLTGGAAAADQLVDATYYDQQFGATLIPAGTGAAQQAASGYDNGGWQAGLNPIPLFDTKFYLAHNPDVAAAHVNPLLHYETYGWKEGRDPSESFSVNRYLSAYADVRAAGMDPLLHYVAYGHSEGRAVFRE